MNHLKLFKGSLLESPEELQKNAKLFDFTITFNMTNNHKKSIISLHLRNQIQYTHVDRHTYYLFFNKDLIQDELERKFLEEQNQALAIQLSYLEGVHLSHLSELLLNNFFDKGPELSLLFVRNIIEQIVLMLMLNISAKRKVSFIDLPDRNKEIAHQFLELVKRDFRSDKKVAQYCKKMGVTEKKLTLSTKIAYAATPKDLIEREITHVAKEMLCYSDLPIKEISYQLGFEEVNNFSAFFKKNTKQAPKMYREMRRQNSMSG